MFVIKINNNKKAAKIFALIFYSPVYILTAKITCQNI